MKAYRMIVLAVSVVLAVACNKEYGPGDVPPVEDKTAVVEFVIEGGSAGRLTKATGSAHDGGQGDGRINTAEFFVFDGDGSLEAYRKFGRNEKLSMEVTIGRKTIFLLVNNTYIDVSGVSDIEEFRALRASLKMEELEKFFMIGSTEVELGTVNKVAVKVSRLVSRIRLKGLSLNLSRTMYEGGMLTDIKVYLTNVHASRLVWNGSEPESSVILNRTRYAASDSRDVAMEGLLYDEVSHQLGDGGGTYIVPHCFYAYGNTISTQTSSDRFTRLVIQGDLGVLGTRYWKVDLNRPGFGYVAGTVPGVEAGKCYECSIKLKDIGDSDPDAAPERESVDVSLSVMDWSVVPE